MESEREKRGEKEIGYGYRDKLKGRGNANENLVVLGRSLLHIIEREKTVITVTK